MTGSNASTGNTTFIPNPNHQGVGRTVAMMTFYVFLGIGIALFLTIFGIGLLCAPRFFQSLPETLPAFRSEPALTSNQATVKKRVLQTVSNPDTTRFEKWYPEVPEPNGWGYCWPLGFRIPCDHVVRVVYRTRGGLGGEFRWDELFYVDHGTITSSASRQTNDNYLEPFMIGQETIVEHYYPND